MGNALWLSLALPQWYFSSLLMPLGAGALTLVPAIGGGALIVGILLGIRTRARPLLLFGVLALLSHVFVALAGLLRGTMRGTDSSAIMIFALLQLAAATYLVYRADKARLPAILLAIFTVSYALFATFIAGMSLSDTWL